VNDWNDLIAKIKENIRAENYGNEEAVKSSIILPVLINLGWDTSDPSKVQPEYCLDNAKRIDYALCPVKNPKVIIEAKSIGKMDKADEQLFNYAFKLGGNIIAILTDGKTWNFYCVGGSGNIEDRKFCSLDLTKDTVNIIKEKMERYLSFQNVLYNKSIEYSRIDSEKVILVKSIPYAFEKLVKDQDKKLIELITEKCMEEDVHIKDEDKNLIISYLQKLISIDVINETPCLEQKYEKNLENNTATVNDSTNNDSSKSRDCSFELFYKLQEYKGEHRNASSMMVDLFKIFEKIRPGFLDEFYCNDEFNKRPRDKTQWISKNKSTMINPKELILGYFFEGCLNNPQKIKILKNCCSILGIKYDKDLKTSL
jgi:hypothetical protein